MGRIGGLDSEEQAGAVGGGGIATAGIRRWFMERVDHVRVNLFEGNEIEMGGAEGGLNLRDFSERFRACPIP